MVTCFVKFKVMPYTQGYTEGRIDKKEMETLTAMGLTENEAVSLLRGY